MKKENAIPFWVWLGLMAVAGGLFLYAISAPFGLGLNAESVYYLQGAKYLALGQGILAYDKTAQLMPAAVYPPGVSILLSAAWFLGLSFVEWARLLNALLFFGNIFLAGAIVFHVTRSRAASLLTAGAVLMSVHVLTAHGKLIAEPLFLLLLLGWFWFMLEFVDTGSRRIFYAAAACAGLSVLARHAGVLIVMTSVVWLGVSGRKDGRVRDTVLFLLAALIVPVCLFFRNYALTGGTGLHFPGPLTFIDPFSLWILPSRVPLPLRWVVFGVCAGVVGGWIKNNWLRLEFKVRQALLLMFFFSVIYCLLSRGLLVAVDVLMLMGLGFLIPLLRSPWTGLKKTAVVMLVVFAALTLVRSAVWTKAFYLQGSGYASKAFTSSKLAETLRSIDDRVPLYSNEPEAVYYLSGRPAVKIPDTWATWHGFPRRSVALRDFNENRAVAVIFDARSAGPDATWKGIIGSLDLEVLMKDTAGEIYGVKKNVPKERQL